MLSLKDCRRLLGPRCTLTDQEILELRDQMHELAVLAVDSWMGERTQSQDPGVGEPDDKSSAPSPQGRKPRSSRALEGL